jgi:rubredoxin
MRSLLRFKAALFTNPPKRDLSIFSKERRIGMDKYECPCGYVYDPAEGDPDNGIDPGTPFEDLPDTWVCPKCGSEQEFFEKLD